ncbi:sigma factor [Aquimarina sp. 2-A2]|uniref:sigma factor n=1 Tax=Aquimarina sp. 2-A2 TaxID=3382644 RepID=UPI00387F05FC
MSSDFYTSLILPYGAIIIKMCRAYTNTQEDFEDYYQEVCLQIWKSKDNFHNQSQWST